eukprot:111574-Prorocentrum_minimum.AAC.1
MSTTRTIRRSISAGIRICTVVSAHIRMQRNSLVGAGRGAGEGDVKGARRDVEGARCDVKGVRRDVTVRNGRGGVRNSRKTARSVHARGVP